MRDVDDDTEKDEIAGEPDSTAFVEVAIPARQAGIS
jgi:hypothetical protein